MEKNDIQINPELLNPLKIGDMKYRSSYDVQLTEQDLEKAHQELSETEKRRTKCLRKLKERLAKDKEVRYRVDDVFLLRYIRYAKFDYKKACEKLHDLYSLRMKHPEIFSVPSELESLLNNGALRYLPYKTEDGCIVLCVNYEKWNPDQVPFKLALQLYNVFMNIATINPSCQINGIITIWDYKGYALGHMKMLLFPSILKLLMDILQDIYPLRIKYFIAVNSNRLMKVVYRLIYPFLKKKITDRMKFLGSDFTELHQFINPVILPKEYGGSLEEGECCITQHVMDNLPYLQYDLSFGFLAKNKLSE